MRLTNILPGFVWTEGKHSYNDAPFGQTGATVLGGCLEFEGNVTLVKTYVGTRRAHVLLWDISWGSSV